jgi:hypothetical protein
MDLSIQDEKHLEKVKETYDLIVCTLIKEDGEITGHAIVAMCGILGASIKGGMEKGLPKEALMNSIINLIDTCSDNINLP